MRVRAVAVLVAMLFLSGIPNASAAGPNPVLKRLQDASYPDCQDPPDCPDCKNTPFVPTHCNTTSSGPARANIVEGNALTSPNMLYCPSGGPYALCFFSGPPAPTGAGLPGQPNPTMQCTPDASGEFANCQCQLFLNGEYYVDINSILNLGAYVQTKNVCGSDGAGCKNLRDCNGKGQDKDSNHTCPATVAPVCAYVDAQYEGPAADALYPSAKADVVSTFSFALGTQSSPGPYTLGVTPCNGVYAGCMTAACTIPESAGSDPINGTLVNCACPLWNGPYEAGQNGQTCPTASDGWVWSAAHSVPGTSAKAPSKAQ